MSLPLDAEFVAARTTDIVVAFLGGRAVEPHDLAPLIRAVRAALVEPGSDAESVPPGADAAEAGAAPTQLAPHRPAVPISESVHRDFLISLEDGRPYRTLRRHLMAKYNMTPDEYRKRWGLPPDYPMVAPSYAEERSAVAKRSGLGTRTPRRSS